MKRARAKAANGTNIIMLVDYSKVQCPVMEMACYEEAVWIMQQAMLGTPKEMELFASAILKIQQAVRNN